ncbi:YlbF family regulator [Streptococcus ferus]|uniref:YlbF family regulator n=1 Tax=Streptococcus ferus TaxID=1345 RepID=UPI0035120781
MLEINDQFFAIEAATERLLKELLKQPEVEVYRQAKKRFETDQALQADIAAFQALQVEFDSQKDYLAFRPEIKAQRRQLLTQKRHLDLNDKVLALRQAEVAVQEILAQISSRLAETVSAAIFVDTGLPLAPHKPPHQKGRGNNIKEKENVC